MADLTGEQLQELVVRYPRLEDAVKAAMIDALHARSTDRAEYGGAIFQRGPNEFYATKPQSSGDDRNLKIRARADQPGDHAVAVYHTHPPGPIASPFSHADLEYAKTARIPSYLSNGDGIQIFDPAIDRIPYVGPSDRRDESAGSAPGRKILDREMLARALRAATTLTTANVGAEKPH